MLIKFKFSFCCLSFRLPDLNHLHQSSNHILISTLRNFFFKTSTFFFYLSYLYSINIKTLQFTKYFIPDERIASLQHVLNKYYLTYLKSPILVDFLEFVSPHLNVENHAQSVGYLIKVNFFQNDFKILLLHVSL